MRTDMARKRKTGTVQRTIRLSWDIEEWVLRTAEKESRTASNMIDVLLRRQKQEVRT